jgi:predicted GNAT family acetyltransferase
LPAASKDASAEVAAGGHPLDRPAWTALTTRQAALAEGDAARAVRIKAEYGIFIAGADHSPASLAAVAALVPVDREVAMVEAAPWPTIPWVASEVRAICQMVAERPATEPVPGVTITPLTDADGPQMLALATLTRPGPFSTRTHLMGDFVGVKEGGRLIAMAGERLRAPGFTEVSGVCTLPEHRGRGLAGALMRRVMAGVVARGETPFLHAYPSNTGAIALYETLGFRLRREMIMTVLTRP